MLCNLSYMLLFVPTCYYRFICIVTTGLYRLQQVNICYFRFLYVTICYIIRFLTRIYIT